MAAHVKYLFAVFIIAGTLVMTGCGNKDVNSQILPEKEIRAERVALTAQSIKEIGLEIQPAAIQTLQRELVVPSKLIANQDFEAHVGTLVQGRVFTVFANLGDHVRRGQELMHIEGVEIGEIKSMFIKAKAHMVFAEGGLKRQQFLVDQNVGSQKALLEAKAEYEKAHAEFIAEDRRIHAIGLSDRDVEELNSDRSKESHIGGILPIKSPIDGIVIERNVVLGQLVDPTTTAFKILNPSTLWVDGQVHENDAKFIRRNSGISVEISSMPGKMYPAKLLYVGEIVDPQTRMVKIRAAVGNSDHRLKPEMFADLHIALSEQTRGIVIQAESIVKDGSEQYLFVALNDTTFEKRSVVCGLTMGEALEIKKGIQPGERIVSKGAFLLKSELKKSIFGEGE